MKVFVKGLNSCGMRKTNVERYQDFIRSNGHELVQDPRESDVVLLWTCAFRGDFRDNSLSEIRRYLKEYRGELIVAGCLPDIDHELLKKEFSGRVLHWKNDEAKLEEFFGSPKKKFSEVPRKMGERPLTDDIDRFRRENPGKDVSFVEQFIKLFIAEGCRFECSYCAEILAFPPYHSFPEDQIVAECKKLVAETGRYDVMLLADSVGDYGCDIGTTLPNLIRKLKAVDPKLRIALQGYNPAHFIRYFDEMKEFLEKGWIRHMQLPIQSASPKILKLMNRPYVREDLDRIFSFLNQLGFKEFDTHLIIGFPGETEEDLAETLSFILRHRPKYVLASGYMETPQMPSSKLPCKIDQSTKLRRLEKMAEEIKKAGILCNSDNSELSRNRFYTLNKID